MSVSHPTADTSPDDTDNYHTVELWMREQSPDIHDRQQAVLTQLRTLTETGSFTDLSVHTWNKYIGAATSEYPDGTTTPALDKASEFETWADQNGHSLQPGFQRRTHSSMVTDTSREVIVPPLLCLAVYEDDTLREVAPCSKPNGHHTVTECLQSLADTATDTTE